MIDYAFDFGSLTPDPDTDTERLCIKAMIKETTCSIDMSLKKRKRLFDCLYLFACLHTRLL
jgi:hypothetical protein